MRGVVRIFFSVCLLIFITGCSMDKLSTKSVEKKKTEVKEEVDDLEKMTDDIVSKMTLEEKIGQLFLIRYDAELIEKDLENTPPSGYVLFAKDIENETKESLREKLKSYQDRTSYKLIFAVDEEGGYVTRVSRFPSFRNEKFKSVRDYYLEGGIDKLVEIEEEKDHLLKEIGVNLNLAPVADVSLDPNDFIYNRTLGEDVSIVSNYINRIVEKANSLNFAVTLKHFPGYGNNVDTHTGVSIDVRSKEELEKDSLPPFVEGIKSKVPVIMISHNIVESYDSEKPASLSKAVHDKLRELGFTGIILTDDLDMDAVQESLNDGNEAVSAFLAGNDLIMTSSYEKDLNALKEALENKVIKEEEIDQKVRSIIKFKHQYGII